MWGCATMAKKDWLDEESSSDLFSPSPRSGRTDETARQCHVLVIEGDPVDFKRIVRHLASINGVQFRPTHAVRLADGLECLAKNDVHVVLLDLDLPDSWGLETLKKLRFHAPQVPVVVLADVDDESLATEAASEGAQDYLVKGELHSGLLVRSIRYCISRNKNRAKLARTLQRAQTSEMNLRNVIAGNVDGMIVLDNKGAIQFANPAAEDLFGLSAGELLRTRFGFPVTDCESGETEILRGDGHSVPVELRLVDVKWEGQPACLAVVHDLTHKKQAEEALRESEKRFRDLFENSPDAIFVEDQDGNVLDANPAACRLHGMNRQTLVGKNVLELVPPDQGEQVARDFPKVVDGKLEHVEGYSWTDDGRAVPIEIRVSRFRYAGKPALLLHVRDVTARKRAEEELRESEERFKVIFENATDGILLADAVTKDFHAGNRKMCQMLACSLDELKVLGVSDVHPKEDLPYVMDQFEKQRRKEITLARDIPVKRRDGTVFYADINSAPVTLGAKTYLMGVFRDITDRKRAEEELRKHREQLEELVTERTAQLTEANEELRREIDDRKRAEWVIRAMRRFLEIANRHTQMDPLLNDFVAEVKSLTGCDSVGIRILDDEGNIPYEAYDGFSQEFYESESPLSTKTDECMCVNVTKGDTDEELPFYTACGSFYVNGTSRFLATVSEESKSRTRNMCNDFGYESVTLVPIRLENRILGLIHVADPKENTVPLRLVELLERAAMELATAVQRVRTEEALQRSEARLQSLIRNVRTAVVVHNSDTSIAMANATACNLLGVTEEQLLGKTADDPGWRFLREDGSDMPVDEYPVNRVLATRQPVQDYVVGVQRPDAQRVLWGLVNAAPEFTADGELSYVIVSFMDITDRRRVEQQVQASLCEKEVLLKEIHHRVKNNMQVISSLLNLQARGIEHEQSREILKDTRSRVTSMAMVHEQLYQSPDLARVDFARHVRSLASYLFRSYCDASGAVVFQEEIGDVDLTLDTAIPCGLIINELVSNALRHAFPDGGQGEIRVGLDHDDDRFVLVVSDNGVGFPADLDFHATNTMGLQVVTTLAGQLNGTIELDRDGGTTVKITFPMSEQS